MNLGSLMHFGSDRIGSSWFGVFWLMNGFPFQGKQKQTQDWETERQKEKEGPSWERELKEHNTHWWRGVWCVVWLIKWRVSMSEQVASYACASELIVELECIGWTKWLNEWSETIYSSIFLSSLPMIWPGIFKRSPQISLSRCLEACGLIRAWSGNPSGFTELTRQRRKERHGYWYLP